MALHEWVNQRVGWVERVERFESTRADVNSPFALPAHLFGPPHLRVQLKAARWIHSGSLGDVTGGTLSGAVYSDISLRASWELERTMAVRRLPDVVTQVSFALEVRNCLPAVGQMRSWKSLSEAIKHAELEKRAIIVFRHVKDTARFSIVLLQRSRCRRSQQQQQRWRSSQESH